MQPIRISDQPDAEMPARALLRIFLPVLEGNRGAGEQQDPEQRQDHIAPVSLMQIIVRIPGQEMPDIDEGIGRHRHVLPKDRIAAFTYRLIESLLCVGSG